MANTEEPSTSNPNSSSQHSTNGDAQHHADDEEIDEEEEDEDVVEEPNRQIPQSAVSKLREQRFKVEALSRRLSSELVPIRVHDVLINGNTKTKDWVIEAELKGIEKATTMQEVMQASQIAISRLQGLEIFDSCKVRLEAGPRELPNTANVIVDVVETDNKLSGECGVYMKPSASSWTAEGTLKYKNLLGYGDLWDASLAYGANQATEEFDVRFAVPFGFYNTALNLGVSAGAVFPWGHGYMTKTSPLPERFYLGGDFSPVCTLGGPTTLWGFKTRGVGPTEPRRQSRDGSNDDNSDSSGWDCIGGDLAVTAFADLSFDLPIRWLREHGIHGHVFAGSGNTAKLTQNEYRHFSPRKFLESFRMSVGCGIVIPTRLFRLEGNYFYVLRKDEHDRGKTGFRFSFSAPS